MNLPRILLASDGYRELGMLDDALAELDALPPAAQARADVRQMRGRVLLQARRWLEALRLYRLLCRAQPADADAFIHTAFCLHELGRTVEARALLLGGPAALLQEAAYHYNLGCYAAVLGELEEAQSYLRAAFHLDKDFIAYARTDPDLRPVWDSL